MKHLLVICFGLLAWAHPARASYRRPAPADTVLGEARIAHLLTQGICAQVAIESRHQDLTVLTRSQGMALLQELLTKVISENLADFEAFMAKAAGDNSAMQRASIKGILDLAKACPTAGSLLTQMGAQMAGVDLSKLSETQKKALLNVAHAMCEQLAAENTTHPLSQRTADERIAAYHKAAASAALATQYQAVLAAFGSTVLTDSNQEDILWKQIDLLMFEECPAYTGLLRVDRGLQQLQADSARAAAPPLPAPKAAPSPRNSKPATGPKPRVRK